ncbi:gliding motility-associated ABC transporter substrate-binding protein GldG [Halosquirtibacter laminarini]|uniref:Gliding motility-associated ABC transporter substrate-binding protein GldG n=1 Tax=Halosquirtibacter laminarini TaxID=3374600 RepID=A0AC61NDG4_9BACT|nr:gliding motility-associated ABC transporter substrate-binding protein GldG [Prolixibacteraceae bacterium]
MWTIIKREIQSFFSSLSGYLVISIFLFATSILLWVFPSDYNLLSTGYANLDGLFDLGPWVMLFLAPAITMKMFAEEKRQRTLELLLTRPISRTKIILGKFLAACILVIIAMIPTVIYYLSVYYLGTPIGCIDSGAVFGSYIGLFFLAAIYIAVGIFCSVTTESQIISFLMAAVINLLLYNAFGVGSQIYPMSDIWVSISSLGIDKHYQSIARGVIMMKDILFFFIVIFLFLGIATIIITWNIFTNKQRRKTILSTAIISVLTSWMSTFTTLQVDLTEDNRFSLSATTKSLLEEVDFPIQFDIYLAGQMPAKFSVFQKNITQKIKSLAAITDSPLHYNLIDPYQEVPINKRQKYFSYLANKGLIPTDIRIKKEEGTSTQLLFPAMIIKGNGKEVVVNLLKRNSMLSPEENLNNSTELLEYEMVRAVQKLKQHKKSVIAFITDGKTLNPSETFVLRNELKEEFHFIDISAERLWTDKENIDAVVVADPQDNFNERTKFILDQYIMGGGKMAVFIDPVSVSLDSLQHGMTTIAIGNDLSLRDQLFQYGIRLNSDLVQDVDCMRLPVNTALSGQKPKYTPAPWYFSPLLMPNQSHPIGKGLDRVKCEFVSSITPTSKHKDVKITPVLTTSPYARITNTPLEVSLEMINHPPHRAQFNKRDIPIGVIMEGKFRSAFQHRMAEAFGFSRNIVIKGQSTDTKILVVADGKILANMVKKINGKMRYSPLGYDRFSKQTFGNKEFISNAFRYLTDKKGISSLSGKVLKIRLLDKIKIRESRLWIQFLNVIFPQLFMIIMGTIFFFVRRYIYRS